MEEKLQRGALVQTVAGRDARGIFILLKVEKGFAYLVDGDKRPLKKPKRKNLKHIRYLQMSDLSIDEQARDLESENSKIRKEIRRFEKTEVEGV